MGGPLQVRREVAALRPGVFWYRAYADSAVPLPVVLTDGVRVHDGKRYVVLEDPPGENAERDIDPERVRNAGTYLARIHEHLCFQRPGRIRIENGRRVVEPFEAGSFDRWLGERLRERTEILRTNGLEPVARDVRQVLDGFERHLPDSFESVLCHDDYSADNVRFEDGEVTEVLDFDYAYAGHRHRDLAKAANGFWMHDPTADWNPRAVFYEGYRNETDLNTSFRRVEPLYRAETHVGTVAALLEMGELSDFERELYAGTIRDALDRVEARAGSFP